MREVLFRGKTKEGEWIYWNEFGATADENGSPKPYCIDMIRVIFVDTAKRYISPETVGQYTGLTDKNGTKIFEGDYLRGLFLFGMEVNSRVVFKDGSFGCLWLRGGVEEFSPFTSICNVTFEIIGNRYDLPAVTEGGE